MDSEHTPAPELLMPAGRAVADRAEPRGQILWGVLPADRGTVCLRVLCRGRTQGCPRGVVHLRAQRRTLPDGRSPAQPSWAGPDPCALGRVGALGLGQGGEPVGGEAGGQGGQMVVDAGGAAQGPAQEINAQVIAAMAEIGVDLGEEYPKPLTDDVVAAADVVVSMGCGDACAVYPGKRYLDWTIDDPAGEPLESVRRIRDDIDLRVRGLLADLTQPSLSL